MNRFRILTHRSKYQRYLNVAIGQERPEGFFIAEPITFKLEDQNSVIRPTIEPIQCRTVGVGGDVHIDNLDGAAFLQACLDAAWEIGMRPSGLGDHIEQVKAIRAHLDDMRRIVMNGKVEWNPPPPGYLPGQQPTHRPEF